MSHADRFDGLLELTPDECLDLLEEHQGSIGRLAFVADDRPLIFPVNYVMHDGRPRFRTAAGSKHDAASEGRVMAFEIDGSDEAARTGWSVVCSGRSSIVRDPDLRASLDRLGHQPYPSGQGRQWVTVERETLTGRRVVHPFTW
jgi:nitroimidazol reductase NimA-like FMN-containing flavoprotein (pyridoxamine 5'-phosphate oxidase superfamily)